VTEPGFTTSISKMTGFYVVGMTVTGKDYFALEDLPQNIANELRSAVGDFQLETTPENINFGTAAKPIMVDIDLRNDRQITITFRNTAKELASVTFVNEPGADAAFFAGMRAYPPAVDVYQTAIRSGTTEELEKTTAARREIHDECTRLLRKKLAPAVCIDKQAARRLFTIIALVR